LLFRIPTTTVEESAAFYQDDYTQGMTTEMPDSKELERLKASLFAGTDRNFAKYVQVLDALKIKKGSTIYDFGTSWGYGTWQLAQAGYNMIGYEIGKSRAAYARDKMGVEVYDVREQVRGKFDVFFSAHVMEHVPSVQETIHYAKSMLKPGGLFVAFTPNGSEEFRQGYPVNWHKY